MDDSASDAVVTLELAPLVKLVLTYMGIILSFAVLGLFFYLESLKYNTPYNPEYYADNYPVALSYFAALIIACGLSVVGLAKTRKLGGCSAFAGLIISVFAPYSGGISASSLSSIVIWWFAIPNAAVGILLLRSWNNLR